MGESSVGKKKQRGMGVQWEKKTKRDVLNGKALVMVVRT